MSATSPMSNARRFLALAGVLGAVGVAAGAFGAHRLGDTLEPRLASAFATAARYHLLHALAMLAVACAPEALWHSPWCARACVAWAVGIVLFAGSLYALALSGAGWLGAITPLGGAALILGWIALVLAARDHRGGVA